MLGVVCSDRNIMDRSRLSMTPDDRQDKLRASVVSLALDFGILWIFHIVDTSIVILSQ